MLDIVKITQAYVQHPRPAGDPTYAYGTAGFRMKSELLDPVMFTVGLLAVLRSKCLHSRVIGAMLTASHNEYRDNGIKLVEPMGEMLVQSWEGYAARLANAKTADALIEVLQSIIQAESIDFTLPANIIIARDTRPSGKNLVDAVIHGVHALGGTIQDYGIFTTPQLHYVVRCLNTAGTPDAYGAPTEEGYFSKLASAFKTIMRNVKSPVAPLFVDCANGVGAVALKKLIPYLGDDVLPIKMFNTDTETHTALNSDCGADFVKLYQTKPASVAVFSGDRCCSLDGDADRVVYYYLDGESADFKLLDGDKIATLAAGFIMEMVKQAQVVIPASDKGPSRPVSVGLVQTAYANGSSTRYVKDVLKVPVVFTPTGVKHLHHAAEEFDVGVYFEANGHGTILFSKEAMIAFRTHTPVSDSQRSALETLVALTDLINQSVGDAISDMLAVEAVLALKGLSPAAWDASYTDLPSRQEKVRVSDRSIFKPINADTELAAPHGLQPQISAAAGKYTHGRCFVRPSGTEDIVRVYSEAATVAEVEELSGTVCGIVFDGYGGVGARPAKYI